MIDYITRTLSELNNKVVALRKRIENDSNATYESQDARHVALDNIQKDFLSGRMLTHLLTCLKSIEAEFPARVTNVSAEEIISNFIRLSLITQIHFKFDSLFGNILLQANCSTSGKTYSSSCEAILKLAGLPKEGSQKNILAVLANIRNSLHNNGIHKNATLPPLTIEQETYSFIKGEKVICASWKHILVAINANIDVLTEVLTSARIGQMQQINDLFSSKE